MHHHSKEQIKQAKIKYSYPEVTLLQDTGIGVAEYAARTCYDSFDSSENMSIQQVNSILNGGVEIGEDLEYYIEESNNIKQSDLLYSLSHTYFHHSILEHANLSFLIKGTSRGVLQEIARHRIQAISVRSTRYTMSSVINAFTAATAANADTATSDNIDFFVDKFLELDMLVTTQVEYNKIEATAVYNKLKYQQDILTKEEYYKLAVAKSSMIYLQEDLSSEELFKKLQSGKSKKNVGDNFKHIVTDNWKVDLVTTMNVRALKNFYKLRDSGAAYFQIQALAKIMKEKTPKKYMNLIELKKD